MLIAKKNQLSIINNHQNASYKVSKYHLEIHQKQFKINPEEETHFNLIASTNQEHFTYQKTIDIIQLL